MKHSRYVPSFLKKPEHIFYPQYAVVSEKEFLEPLLLESPQDYVAITTFHEVDFDQEGTYEVLIGLKHLKTKKSQMRTVFLTVESTAMGTSFLKLGYWRSYGFVLEGQLNKTSLALSHKEDVAYSAALLDASGQAVQHFEGRSQNWYNRFKYDSYQLLIPNAAFERLEFGSYRLQIHAVEKSSGKRIISELVESIGASSLMTASEWLRLTEGIECREVGAKSVSWTTRANGAVHLLVSPLGDTTT